MTSDDLNQYSGLTIQAEQMTSDDLNQYSDLTIQAERCKSGEIVRANERPRVDALLPDETVGKAPHRWRWRIPSGVFANCNAKQGRSSGGGALLQFADDALGDIAHGVNRTDH